MPSPRPLFLFGKLFDGCIPPEFLERVEFSDRRHENVNHDIDKVQQDPAGSPIPFGVPGLNALFP